MATNSIIDIKPDILVWDRESLGLTQEFVAERLDKDVELIRKWETGEAKPSLAQLEKLAYKVYKRPLVATSESSITVVALRSPSRKLA